MLVEALSSATSKDVAPARRRPARARHGRSADPGPRRGAPWWPWPPRPGSAWWCRPPDVVQGKLVRLIYVHPAAATTCYVGFGLCALASLAYLWPRTRSRRWDRLAAASAEVGRGLLRHHPGHRVDLGSRLLGGVVDVGRPPHPHRPACWRSSSATWRCAGPAATPMPAPALRGGRGRCAPCSCRWTTRPPPGGRPCTRATPCCGPTR